jgi:hypothetical protein
MTSRIVKINLMVYVYRMDIATLGGTGYKIKGKNAVVLVEDGKVKIDREKPFVIDSPGEYEVSDVSVIGIQDSVGSVYVIEADNLRICVLTGIGEKLNQEQVEEIGSIDIAVLPKLNLEVVKQVDPWVVLTETTSPDTTAVAKYSITSDKLPTEIQTVVLERK